MTIERPDNIRELVDNLWHCADDAHRAWADALAKRDGMYESLGRYMCTGDVNVHALSVLIREAQGQVELVTQLAREAAEAGLAFRTAADDEAYPY